MCGIELKRFYQTCPGHTEHAPTHAHAHVLNMYIDTHTIHDLNAEWFYFIDYIWFFLDSICFLFCECAQSLYVLGGAGRQRKRERENMRR